MLFIRKGLPLVSSTCGWRNKKCQMEFQNEEQNQQGFSTDVAGFDRQGKNFGTYILD
jgi:hypothetical protein